MDAETRAKRRDTLKQLYDQLQDSRSECDSHNHSRFFSLADLQALRINARHVDIDDDDVLQFSPCFFRPCADKQLLQKYPVNYEIEEDGVIPNLGKYEEWEASMRQEEFERSGDSSYLEPEGRWETYSHDTQNHIERQIIADRHGCPYVDGMSSLRVLGTLRTLWRYFPGRVHRWEFNLFEPCSHGTAWRDRDWLEDPAEDHPLPHAIFSITAHVRANDSDQSLTHSELRAILQAILIRTSTKDFRNYVIHPILLISYMGEKHARIIQAHYDGKQLNIQYSKLWSFQDPNTAPVELFIRYFLSQLVGLRRTTLCIR